MLRSALVLSALAVACAGLAPPGTRLASSGGPTLVVFITVDQLGSDYLERYGANLPGGLGRLRNEGAVWMRGVHDHAITETAPGHASTMSGRFPVRTGISSNSQGVNTTDAPLIGSDDFGASPFRFVGTTLYDWMTAVDPSTRALSVSRKDRGAILPIGSAKTEVYWFTSEGAFTTSTYYRIALPTWVSRFNARRAPHESAGQAWDLLLAPERYAEPDTVPRESNGRGYTFPHVAPSDPDRAAGAYSGFPWVDSLTLQFALEGVDELRLGASARRTDLLAISLSATDAVGHRWGPDSREIHDQILRLDRYLGQFLDSLFTLRDRRRVVIALTADHGVAPYPELRSPYYANHAAQKVDVMGPLRFVKERMLEAGVDTAAVMFDDGFRVVDAEAFRRVGADPDAFAALWVRELRRLNGVLRADLVTDLAAADTVTDHLARRWLHMFDASSEVRAVVTFTPFSYHASVTYATHGSPHDYDALVPIVFWGTGITPGARTTPARVVDMAPTLAALLGVTPLEPLDGRVLSLTPPRP
ncbi:MAG: alkaline phosphatase family protein [Gemmatimonadaceae bacterium]